MVNLAAFLNTQTQVLTKKKSYVRANILDLTKKANRGTATLRIIADKSGVPTQTIKGLYQIFETVPRFDEKGNPVYNEDGTQATRFSSIEIPKAINYDLNGINGIVRPSDIQLNKLRTLNNLLEKYMGYLDDEVITQEETETNMGVRVKSCLTTFWAKVFSVVPKGGSNIIEEPDVYLCKHYSANFITTFRNVSEQQVQARGADNAAIYFNKFVSNEPAKYDATLTISTLYGEGQVGYSIAISMMDGLKQYDLTKEDVDQCEDLATVGWNFKEFDDHKVDTLIEKLQKNVALAEQKGVSTVGATTIDTPKEPEGLEHTASTNPFDFDSMKSAPVSATESKTDSANPFDGF